MSEKPQWYVLHTYSGYENKVKTNLEKTIENRGMGDKILEVTIPVEETVEVKNGKTENCSTENFSGICPCENDFDR